MRYLLLTAALLAVAGPVAAQPAVPFADAAVHAVQFVDASEGWAAGDDGVVWHSIDGGATWERQKTGTRASLRGLHFTDPYTGWAVGRRELPAGGGSVGVLLRTANGGLAWEEVGTNALPGLHAVRFFDEANGVVCGDGSDAFPGGLFTTADGGKTWRPVATAARVPSWRAMDFAANRAGVLGGAWAKLATAKPGEPWAVADAELDPLGGRTIHGVKVGERRAFAVGDGGTVLTSGDGGRKWGFADLPLPASALACCDFKAVAAVGGHVWVAGRPGSVVLHSADDGKTWDVQATNSPVPLNGLHFITDKVGWAVGDLGTVLGTADGGKTWKVQRLGGQRAAVLCLHAAGRSTPLETVALLGGADGYLAASVNVTTADPATADPKRAGDAARLRQAVRLAGGAAADSVWCFPLPAHAEGLPPRDLLAVWDKAHGGKAAEQLLRQAVLAVRLWQPEVIVADAAAPGGPATAVLCLHAAKEAFEKAADPAAFPEQIQSLGLKPWAAKKLYAPAADAATAAVKLDLTEWNAPLGDSPKDFAEPAVRVLADDSASAGRACFTLVSHRLPGSEAHTTLMQGIDLAPGGTARRPAAPVAVDVEGVAERKKASQTRRHLEGVAAAADPDGGKEKLLAPLASALKEMPDDAAARTASAVATRFVSMGRWAEAREVYALLADKYPGHPLAAEAYRWLILYHASSEARHRVDLQERVIFQHAAFQPKGGTNVVQAGVSGTTSGATTGVVEDTFQVQDADAIQRWHTAALELEPKLSAFGPVYSRDPAAWLCLLAARRNLGMVGEAEKAVADYFKAAPAAVAATPGADVYRDCLAAEAWSVNRGAFAAPPKPAAVCRFTETRPFLDGKLDDPCWQGHTPLKLAATAAGDRSDDAKAFADGFKTEVMFAYDDRFLYVAVRCAHPAGMTVPPAGKRGRDADLAGRDRVDVLLDLDRDYQTYYRFQVDQRGCLAEDCWGDKTWNPRYFTAFHPTETGWTAEFAVPLTALTGDRPSHGRTWAVNVSRVVPGRGVQAWSGPASADPRPEGMGLLQFRAGN